jgi:carboxymethylenebutenolidase
MLRTRAQVVALLLVLGAALGGGVLAAVPDTVLVRSGDLELRALLWRPPGRGPFPAVLFNHGSGNAAGVDASGRPNQRHPELLGPVFTKHGYAFLYLFRRGDGLSRGQGVPSGDRMDSAFVAGGQEARNLVQQKLLETDELGDALAGLAYLRSLPEVDSRRIALVGHSFGGSLTLLLAERDNMVRAVVLFSAAGYSFDRSPQFRRRLMTAVDNLTAAAFFLNARNDYSLSAAETLTAELARLGKPSLSKVYPPVGRTAHDGHDFVHRAIPTWEPDVFAFLDEHTR